MTKEEVTKQLKRIESNYPFYKIDTDKLAMWFEFLKKYENTVVHKAVTEWMMHNSKEPTVADIVDQINAATTRTQMQNRYQFEDPNQKTVRCWKCQDHGCITVLYPTKVEAVRFCDCSAGQRFGRPYADDENRKRLDDFESKYLFGVGIKTFRQGKVTEERLIDDKTSEVFVRLTFNPGKTIVELPNRSKAPKDYKELLKNGEHTNTY